MVRSRATPGGVSRRDATELHARRQGEDVRRETVPAVMRGLPQQLRLDVWLECIEDGDADPGATGVAPAVRAHEEKRCVQRVAAGGLELERSATSSSRSSSTFVVRSPAQSTSYIAIGPVRRSGRRMKRIRDAGVAESQSPRWRIATSRAARCR